MSAEKMNLEEIQGALTESGDSPPPFRAAPLRRSAVRGRRISLPSRDQVLTALRRNKWFRDLPIDVISELVPALRLEQYAKDQLVHAKCEEATRLYCVVEGGVRASSISHDGLEAVFALWGIGGWIGLGGLLDGQTRALDIRACQPTTLATLGRREFNLLLKRHPILYRHLALQMCEIARGAFAAIEDETVLSHRARLAKRLIELADSYGVPHRDGTLIDLHLPQQALASLLHVSRATVNKRLVEWRRLRWIDMHYGKIMVTKRKELERLFSDCT